MRTPALCISLSFKRLSLAAAVVSSVLAGSVAHASPFSAYAGATIGLAPNSQNCYGQTTCDRMSGGGKAYAGWNVTPNVAAEINYFYFGANNGALPDPDITKVRNSARSMTFGMNWNFEMFETLSSHIRLGIARTRNRSDYIDAKGVASYETDYTTGAYLGLGLSIPFNRNVRMVTGYDFISVSGAGNRSRHLLSGGLQAEF